MPNQTTIISHIRELIAKDDFENAIKELSALLKDSPRLNEAILQSARYNDLMQQIRLGVVDFQAANVTKNQIRLGVLDLLALKEIELSQEDNPSHEKQQEKTTIIQNADKIYNIDHIDTANFS